MALLGYRQVGTFWFRRTLSASPHRVPPKKLHIRVLDFFLVFWELL